jgi:hypothetical protein
MIAQVTVRFLPAIELNCVLESKHLKKEEKQLSKQHLRGGAQ